MPSCVKVSSAPLSSYTINFQGLFPNFILYMDFTHVHSLGKVDYVSVIAHFGGSPQEKQLMIILFFKKTNFRPL